MNATPVISADGISETIYSGAIPQHVADATESLYQHRYASLLQVQLYNQLDGNVHVYSATRHGQPLAALLFRIDGRRACVLNEQMMLGKDDIERFAQHVFAHFSSIEVISFPVVHADVRRLARPHQQACSTLDIVATLPPTVPDYMARLGKSTRAYVKRYLNKIRREHPDFSFRIYEKEEIDPAHVRALIALNKARMSGRQQSSYIDAAEEERMLKLLLLRGFVGVATINGRVCAGTINTRFGANTFLQVVAHDPAYNDYGLGTLACYLTICACIERGGHAYHFLWGQYEYKYRLLGVQRDLNHVVVYRSRLHQLRHAPLALRMALTDARYKARSWLLNKGRRRDESSFVTRTTYDLIQVLRAGRRQLVALVKRNNDPASPGPTAS